MPELPEVETVRRFVAPVLEGSRLVDVELRHVRVGRRNRDPAEIPARLKGHRVVAVGRRGKFLLASIEGGITWVTHLGMSGRVHLAGRGAPIPPHTHFVARVEGGTELRLVDPRTFGFVAAFTPAELAASSLASLGPDALTELPRTESLGTRLAGRSAPIKALLLDQRFLAGLGNIYADEALHRAGIRPLRPGGDLMTEEIGRLRPAISRVLREGIRHGGTSLDDLAYLLPDGRAGRFLARLRVYGREGRPCRSCGSAIRRVTIRGRSGYFCPECQR